LQDSSWKNELEANQQLDQEQFCFEGALKSEVDKK